MILDYHFSHWHITNIRFDNQLNYLDLANQPEVIAEMFTYLQFSGFLPAYHLSDNDTLIISQTQYGAGQPILTFETPSALQSSYLITVFEPPAQPQSLTLSSGQTINQTFPLSTSRYGIISVYTAGLDSSGQPTLGQFNTGSPLLRLPFEVK